jgi:hypothetical protein
MDDIVNRIEGIHHILELKYKREVEHCAHMHKTDDDARGSDLRQLKAQLHNTAKLIGYLNMKTRERRKLRL